MEGLGQEKAVTNDFKGGGGGGGRRNLRNTIFAVTSFLNGPYTTGFFKIVSFAKKNNF